MYTVLEPRSYRDFSELTDKEKSLNVYDCRGSSLAEALSEDIRMSLNDMFKEMTDNAGLPSYDVCWSLSSCQGDGVSLFGNVRMTEELMDKILGEGFENCKEASSRRRTTALYALKRLLGTGYGQLDYALFRNSHAHLYTHEHCISCEVMFASFGDTSRLAGIGGTSKKIEEAIECLKDALLYYVRSLCVKMKMEGYNVIWDIYSDASVKEFCEMNGIVFDEYGRPYWGRRFSLVPGGEEVVHATV